MPRTFSLRWLLLVVTFVCVTCAALVHFPFTTYMLLFVAGFFFPATVACVEISRRTSRPAMVGVLGTLGAVFGTAISFWLAEMAWFVPNNGTHQGDTLLFVVGSSGCAALGAVLANGPVLLWFSRQRPLKYTPPPADSG